MAGTEKQREEINRKLVSSQMEIIGLTYEDAMNTPEFWRVYTLTTEQTELWRKDALKLIQKTFKCNRKRGEMIMVAFELNLGLRIEDLPTTTYIHTTIPEEDTLMLRDFGLLKDVKKLTFLQKLKKVFKF
jgi:hypothetical protein